MLFRSDNEHIVEEKLVLKANEKEFSFPLVKQDITRKSTMIDAYITDKSFPLDHDVVVALSVKYRYGYDNSYELILKPVNGRETAFKEIVVEWANTDRKANVLNIWPPATNKAEASVILLEIEETQKSLDIIVLAEYLMRPTLGSLRKGNEFFLSVLKMFQIEKI